MKLFFNISKRNLFVIFSFLIIVFFILSYVSSINVSAIDGSTNSKRVEFINGLKIKVSDSCDKTKEIVIPLEFSSVYKKYNECQNEAGFDLSEYKGKKAIVYTYPCLNSESVVNLIVVDGKIVGGDVSEADINGKMLPLKEIENGS